MGMTHIFHHINELPPLYEVATLNTHLFVNMAQKKPYIKFITKIGDPSLALGMTMSLRRTVGQKWRFVGELLA